MPYVLMSLITGNSVSISSTTSDFNRRKVWKCKHDIRWQLIECINEYNEDLEEEIQEGKESPRSSFSNHQPVSLDEFYILKIKSEELANYV